MTKQKFTGDRQKTKRMALKHNTTENHQIMKRGRKKQRNDKSTENNEQRAIVSLYLSTML